MNVITPATKFLLTLSMLKGVGPASLKKVAAIPGFLDQKPEALGQSITQIARALASHDAWLAVSKKAEQQMKAAEKHQARIISAADPEYPLRLATTKDDPFILYVKGTLAPESMHAVAIIGTREPTEHGVKIAHRVSQFFAENGSSIVSGLALGCDAIAHQTALEVGGHTVAVLAHGLQTIAPSQHKKLAEQIVECGGALVSEYPFGQSAQAQQFVKRDRIQAGLADGVVMIQSDLKGGSLHASRSALQYGRWLAVPYPTDRDRGNNEPKVQANLLVAEGSPGQKAELLRCSEADLHRIVVLRSREDYQRLLGGPFTHAAVGSGRGPSASVETATCDPINVPNDETSGAPNSQTDTNHTEPVNGLAANVADEHMGYAAVELLVKCRDRSVPSMTDALTTIEKFKNSACEELDSELAMGLMYRIKFLQKKLEEIAELRLESHAAMEKVMFLLFSVEGALLHMKSVANFTAHPRFRSWFVSQHRFQRPCENQMSMLHADSGAHQKRAIDELLTLLQEHVAAAVRGNKLPGATPGYDSPAVDEKFDDLVRRFNDSLSLPAEQLEEPR